MATDQLARWLIVAGLLLAGLGLLLLLLGRLPLFGHLPGDLSFTWGNLRLSLPLATSLLLSLLLTLLLNLFFWRR
jgi:hypothetical protein